MTVRPTPLFRPAHKRAFCLINKGHAAAVSPQECTILALKKISRSRYIVWVRGEVAYHPRFYETVAVVSRDTLLCTAAMQFEGTA